MKYFTALFFALLIGHGLHGEAPCPANINSSIPFDSSQQHQIVVPVSINHAGPFRFLIDTGAQMTVIDHSLAIELHLASNENADVAGVSFRGHTELAHVDTLEIGDRMSTNQKVLVLNMSHMHRSGSAIRGLLGEDFLSRFNVLIDHEHSVLCIGDAGRVQINAEYQQPTKSSSPAIGMSEGFRIR